MGRLRGTLELLSDAVRHPMHQTVRVPVLRIDGDTVRGAWMNDELYGLLVPGRNYELGFGRLLHRRWLLTVKEAGHTHRCGLISFLFFNTVAAWLFGIIAGLISSIVLKSHDAQAQMGVLAGIGMFGWNAYALLRPGSREG